MDYNYLQAIKEISPEAYEYVTAPLYDCDRDMLCAGCLDFTNFNGGL